MKPSNSFFLPLGLLILSLLFASSLAHDKSHEATCTCHGAISSPVHNKNQEASSPPAHEANSPPVQNKNHEANSPPTNESDPPPIQNKNRETTSSLVHHEANSTSPPAQNKNHETTSPPTQNKNHEATLPPTQNKNHEATSPPTDNKNHETTPPSTQNKNHEATSPPTQNKNHETAQNKNHEVTSPPVQNKNHETTSPPVDNKNHETTSPPAQNKNHEVTSPPAQNKNREDTSLLTDNKNHEATLPPAQNKKHEATSPPVQNKNHETTSPPADNKNHEVTSPPAQNNNHEVTSPPAQNKNHEDTSLPPNNKNHEVISPPADNKSSNEASTLPSSYKGFFGQLFAFGESYTDRGNAFLLENNASSSGGESSANQQDQFCDGRLVVDFLCDALALPTLPPYKATSVNFTFGVNFAIAGSTALPSSFFAKLKFSGSFWKRTPTESFQTQIDWFNKFKSQMECKDKDNCKAKMANALFWIGELGVDDYARIHGLKLSLRRLAENSVANVARILHALLDSGARYIVVQGLPPVGCLPIDIKLCPLRRALDHLGCVSAANAAIMVHNNILQKELQRFRALHPHCSILYADYWRAFLEILANPVKYHFEEPFKACCGAGGDLNFDANSPCGSPGTSKCKDPSRYINWDGIHLTQAMHRHITDLFLNHGYCQPSFAELIKQKTGM